MKEKDKKIAMKHIEKIADSIIEENHLLLKELSKY